MNERPPPEAQISAQPSGEPSKAKNLNLTVTGEGIKTADQLQRLRDLGCNMGQGYLFAYPVPASDITDILNTAVNGTSSLAPRTTNAA